jgi:Lamin Tail Domain
MNIVPISHIVFLITVISLTACGGNAPQSLKILPQDCSLSVSEQIGLTLSGQIDPNSKITWATDLGSILNSSQGAGALYTAPSVAGEAKIEATITSGVSAETMVLTVLCRIIDPTITASPPGSTQPGSVPPPQNTKPTIIISEVMGNTCGGVDQRKYNQYVELYNYGDQPVDVSGLRLYDEGDSGSPDEITTWNKRSSVILDSRSILDSTIIPAKGIAIVLSPKYFENPNGTPYTLPTGTIILTVAESSTLGDDYFGIIADQNGYDTVTLYMGGATVINTVLDTYGTPFISTSYPFDIDDDHKDNIPRYLSECTSIERIDPLQPDTELNWRTVQNGSPGEVPFK